MVAGLGFCYWSITLLRSHDGCKCSCCSLQAEMKASRSHKRVYELFCKAAATKVVSGAKRKLDFIFFRSPHKLITSESGERVAGVSLERTILGRHISCYALWSSKHGPFSWFCRLTQKGMTTVFSKVLELANLKSSMQGLCYTSLQLS